MLGAQHSGINRKSRTIVAQNNQPFTLWFNTLDRISFHACMHGGTRAKHTRLLATAGVYNSLQVECDQSHSHQPWNIVRHGAGLKFDTATEAEYPTLLCKRMADPLCSHLNLPLQTRPPSQHAEVSLSLGNRVTKAKPLIPEFFDIQLMTTDLPPNARG